MLKRTLFLGMIAACLVVQTGYADNHTSVNKSPSSCTASCINYFLVNQANFITSNKTAGNELPKDLIFKVVIGDFIEPLDIESSFLRKVRDDLTIEKTMEGTVRYVIGAFREYKRAELHCENLKAKGYRHAKVMAYSREEVLVIPMEELLQLMQTP